MSKIKKILVVSNRVFSTTDNNGKTLYSIVEELPKEQVAQLYFYGNPPAVPGFNYFQLSDKDILLGRLNPQKRGRVIKAQENEEDYNIQNKYGIKRSDFVLLMRELVWKNAWKSRQLDNWLDAVNPDTVFFMAGDCLFAYHIVKYIVNKYCTKLITYVTDDYVLPREHEALIARYRRGKIKELMGKCIQCSQSFYTISERMRREYRKLFGKDSKIIFNISESLYDIKLSEQSRQNEKIELLYTGSLYYGRDEILLLIAKALNDYNKNTSKRAVLRIYSRLKPAEEYINALERTEAAKYGGMLDKDGLKAAMNQSNILVFVESFDNGQIEKTRLSFSTKIPEYLSVGKPILAIGPEGIGAMDCLQEAAACAYSKEDIYNCLKNLLENENMQYMMAEKAKKAYTKLNQKTVIKW